MKEMKSRKYPQDEVPFVEPVSKSASDLRQYNIWKGSEYLGVWTGCSLDHALMYCGDYYQYSTKVLKGSLAM